MTEFTDNYDTLRATLDGGVLTLVIDRPETLNSLNGRMRQELRHAFEAAPQAGARAILLTAEGRAFCSGQDLTEDLRQEAPDLERPLREEYEPMLHAIVNCPLPVISAVNGTAAGAGVSLALAADMVVAAESAEFIVAFARIGLVPDVGLTWILPRLVGVQRAMGLSLTTEPLRAIDAEAQGLIWRAIPDDRFAGEARTLAARLANGPTKSYGMMKRLMRQSMDQDFPTQLEAEAQAQGEAGRSRDFAEGVAAFMDKRVPKFTGR